MYTPNPFPGQSVEDLTNYVQIELQKLADLFTSFAPDGIGLTVHHNEPDKPSEGWVYYADGSDWDPGAGKGPYIYTGNEWLPLITPSKAEKPRFKTLRLTGFAPSFTNTTQKFSPPAATLRLTGYTVGYTDTTQRYGPTKATLTLTGIAPSQR